MKTRLLEEPPEQESWQKNHIENGKLKQTKQNNQPLAPQVSIHLNLCDEHQNKPVRFNIIRLPKAPAS